MNIYTNTPYTYRICWSKTGMNYYGVRYAKNCHPFDLFVTYFTSSTYVAEYIKEHGMPDIIEVRKTFTGEDRVIRSLLYERRVLTRLKITIRDDYLNKAIGGCLGATLDPEVQKKQLENLKKSLNTDEYRKKRQKVAREINARPEIKEAQIKAWTKENNRNYVHTVYSFVNVITGIKEQCTPYELCEKYPELSRQHIGRVANGKRNSSGGWVLEGVTPSYKAHKNNMPNIVYNFVHDSGIYESSTLTAFAKKYNLGKAPLRYLRTGKWKQYKGWRMQNL